jgi:hypothetical protein
MRGGLATKQSSLSFARGSLDCRVASLLAMTAESAAIRL